MPDGDLRRYSLDGPVQYLQQLIRFHPVFASDGQLSALDYCAERLAALGYEVQHVEYTAAELIDDPRYVDVSKFGGKFEPYSHLRRSLVTARKHFGDGGAHLLLNGHVDVEEVSAPHQWRTAAWDSGLHRDGFIYGRGSSDMLGGIASYLWTLQQLDDELVHRAQ